jgi:hypothetical protein
MTAMELLLDWNFKPSWSPIACSNVGSVEGILSVDISEWDEPGILYGKPVRACTAEEIKKRFGRS